MNFSVPKITVSAPRLSANDFENTVKSHIYNTPTPTIHNLSKYAKMSRRKLSRKRLSFSPNINSTAMQSPDCSPIVGENCLLNVSTSPCDFSPCAPNQIKKSEAETSSLFHNLSYLNKTIPIENILKSNKIEKYVDVFQKHEIYNLVVFASLTEQDLIEIGISKKKDRLLILEIVAEYKGDL